MHRSKLFVVGLIVLLAALVVMVTPAATAKKPDPPGLLIDLQLLAFNDYHGHVLPNDAGTVAGTPAGGGEYLAAKLAQLRQGKKYSLTVAAGDLIGGSPAFSGLFHDEPSVESLNAMKLDVSSVGNHEFDEGVTELLRMQNGGCHPPVDGCYFPDQPYAGADFQWLAANTVHETTGQTPLPPYWIERFQNVKVGFIGMTLCRFRIGTSLFAVSASSRNFQPWMASTRSSSSCTRAGRRRRPRARSTAASGSRGRSSPSTMSSAPRSTRSSPVTRTCRTTACSPIPRGNRASSRARTRSGASSRR
jgi:hypothetical protein